MPDDDENAGDQLLSVLGIYFRGSKSDFNMKLLQETASKQFASNSTAIVSEDTVQKLGELGSVEAFTLSQFHSDSTIKDWNKKVSFYLDEAGQLKNLPANSRAVAFATLCGFDNVPLVGDMFVGRLLRMGSGVSERIKNVDFLLAELESSSDWLKDLKTRNYQLGIATNKVAMDSGDSSGDVVEGESVDKVYQWSESSEYVEVVVNCVPAIGSSKKLSSKDVKVDIRSKTLKVMVKDDSGQFCLLLDINLAGNVSVDDSTWSLGSAKGKVTVDVTLAKQNSSKKWGKVEEE